MTTWQSALFLLVGTGLLSSGASAQQPRTSIGVLTCTSGAGIEGKGAADNPDLMTCGFKPTASGGGEERYTGRLRSDAGAAKSSEGKRVLVWSVLGPEGKLGAGVLAQKYISAARRTDGAQMILVGESNNAITLQAETSGGAGPRVMEVELKLLTTPA